MTVLSLIMSNERIHISKKGSVFGVASRCEQCFCFVIYTWYRFFVAYIRIVKLRNFTDVSTKIPCGLVLLRRCGCQLRSFYVYTKQVVPITSL
jgi:hypothetical protein